MSVLKRTYTVVKDFFIKYPAVLSGYIIYLYFFFATMDFYQNVKDESHSAIDLFQNFDALLWMWLLSYALVKIIDYRAKLLQREKEELIRRREIDLKETQLNTLHEVVRALQHDINNPLTIIFAYARKAERSATENPEMLEFIKEIRGSADRIAKSLTDFSRAQTYQTVTTPFGPITTHGKENVPS